MARVHSAAKHTLSAGSSGLHVLDSQGYKEIQKKPRTFEIHLASALFPGGKITAGAVKKVVVRKAPASGTYNAIFHFRRDRDEEFMDTLEKAWHQMPNDQGGWYIKYNNFDGKAEEERVRKILPKGKVRSADIDKALSSYSITDF